MGRWKSKEVVAVEPVGAGIALLAYNVGMSNNAKRGLVGAGLVLALAYMIYLTTSGTGVSCEVCVEFRGNTECRKATGKDREEAETAAASTACGLLSGGVTDGIACRNTVPKSVTCQNR
jgi:hypothetical protein